MKSESEVRPNVQANWTAEEMPAGDGASDRDERSCLFLSIAARGELAIWLVHLAP